MSRNTEGTSTNKRLATKPRLLTCIAAESVNHIQKSTLPTISEGESLQVHE
jgi:hypothetical protein